MPVLPLTALAGYVLTPLVLLLGADMLVHGHLTPGGGFQSGVVLATGVHLLYIAGDLPALRRLRPLAWCYYAEALATAFPDVAGAFALAAEQMRNGAAYSAQVLGDGGSAVIPVAAPHWTATGIGLSLLSTGLAVVLAAMAVRPPPVPRVLRPLGPISRRCIDVLHEVHSGHAGDYVAWLLLGVTVLAALVAVPVVLG
ncbi:MnhB domain-containing protein [Saccharopolyspora elongata]|uniref:MnhB domain-containing protein n=1 Tax=Saccharopolyspora elongata TaxID=2530387 RepID=UPI001F2FD3B8|nr:MnhB domain-containing protein [Saccharopolyspora elongata]